MQRKPQPAFDRFNEKPAFRGDRFSEGGDRFGGERRPRFPMTASKTAAAVSAVTVLTGAIASAGTAAAVLPTAVNASGAIALSAAKAPSAATAVLTTVSPSAALTAANRASGTVPARARRPLKPAATRTVPPLCRRRPCGLMPMWPRTLRTLRP